MPQPPWSATRTRTFQECRRKYYLRYHLAPLARRPEAPQEAYQADRVKDLLGVEAWAGELVHKVIEEILLRWRAGRPVTLNEALQRAEKLLSRQFRVSHDYWGENPEAYPKRPSLLDMHYYKDRSLSREKAGITKETVLGSLRAFWESDLAARIKRAGSNAWLPIDRNAAARLGDTLILVKPDFAFREGPRLIIVDWKTGKPDPFWEMVQVTGYALYAWDKWLDEVPDGDFAALTETVEPLVAHLHPHFHYSETEFTPDSIREVLVFIRESQDQLVSLLDGSDLPPVQRFPTCEDPKRCRWCCFRGMCDGSTRPLKERTDVDGDY
jgi:hypothetical protein